MRVLWFTNCLTERACAAFGASRSSLSGGWMDALYDAVVARDPALRMCIASADSASGLERTQLGSTEFVRFPAGRRGVARAISLVHLFAPDVVHVHGSEFFYGLVAQDPSIRSRVAISLQGLVGACSAWPAFFGNLPPWQVLQLHRLPELAIGRGLLPTYFGFRRNARREREILSLTGHVLGRTAWDRAHAQAINPGVRYHHVGELLRVPFWSQRWDIGRCRRQSIIFTNAGHPRKGVEVLLDAFQIVRRSFPDAILRVAGGISSRSGYGRHMRRTLGGLSGVELLGSLDASQMVRILCDTHLFVSPSFIDNSPNALCEAQLVGMPVVATYVGGVPSLVEEGRTGLFAPAGDPAPFAQRIMQILSNDELAQRLGAQAREVAQLRHAPDAVVEQLLSAYRTIANGGRSTA